MRAGRAGTTMFSMNVNRVEELRQAGLAKVRENSPEDALALYDAALQDANDDETRELIGINKADALIILERSGPEVTELPRVIMRRRNARHVYLAAYALQYKHRLENDLKRALFYGELALRTAEEAGEPVWRRVVLVELGNMYTSDSRIERAIECFEGALIIDKESAANNDLTLSQGLAMESLGYCHMLAGDAQKGLDYVHESMTLLSDPIAVAEAFVDLCFGYLETGNLSEARSYGERALEIATEQRHIRNAHYLLGEVCYTLGDSEKADHHFDELARFYPEFKNLKSLLYAIDLRSMVNLKL
jgi:tetratricopeptide (TPR) repeat protein